MQHKTFYGLFNLFVTQHFLLRFIRPKGSNSVSENDFYQCSIQCHTNQPHIQFFNYQERNEAEGVRKIFTFSLIYFYY